MRHFDALCDLSDSEREPRLQALQGRDPELACELRKLLRHDLPHESAGLPGQADVSVLMQRVARDIDEAGASSQSAHTSSGRAARREEAGRSGASEVFAPSAYVAGRYRIGRALGSGGAGAVFWAHDSVGQREVAIKFLRRTRLTDPRDISRFRREFRAISRLNHPGCLQVFAEGVEGDQRYIVMEYVPGGHLSAHSPPTMEARLYVLAQLAATLDYVHSRGVLHRDLKPQNILLYPAPRPTVETEHDGRVSQQESAGPGTIFLPKLADFGIAKLFDEESSSLSETSGLVGTLDYVSPEQVRGATVDARSDLYSFGCVIYKLWTGRAPFAGNTFERLSARLLGPPAPLRSLLPNVPPALDDLVARLLAPDPTHRPQSAVEVGRVLAALLRQEGGPSSQAPLWLASGSARVPVFQARFVGRDDLLSEVLKQAQAASAGDAAAASLIVIGGEAGVGKTAVLRVARQRLEAAGLRVIVARVPAQSAGPLAPFPELFARIAEDTADSPSGSLGRGLGRPAQDGLAALRVQALALAEALGALHRQQPLVLIFDDLHDATESALLLLRELLTALRPAGRPRSFPLIVASLRPPVERLTTWLGSDPTGGGTLRSADGPAPAILRLDLRPLSNAEVDALALSMLGGRDDALPASLSAYLWRESGGSPLLSQATLRALAERGCLQQGEQGVQFVPPTSAEPAPESEPSAHARSSAMSPDRDRSGEATAHESVLAARLAQLAPETRTVLTWAAVIGLRFDLGLLLRVARLDEDQVIDSIDEALRAGIVSTVHEPSLTQGPLTHDTYEFEHLRLVDVLDRSLSPAERVERQRAVLAVLQEQPDVEPARLAHHAVLAERPHLALHALLSVGRAALRGDDYAAAERAFQDALLQVAAAHTSAVPIDDPSTDDLHAQSEQAHEGLADAQIMLGQPAIAAQSLQRLLQDAASSTRPLSASPAKTANAAKQGRDQSDIIRARRLRKLGLARLRLGDPALALSTLEQGLGALGDSLPLGRVRLFGRLIFDTFCVLWYLLWPLRSRRKAPQEPTTQLGIAHTGSHAQRVAFEPQPSRSEECVLIHRELALLYRWVDDLRTTAHNFAFARAAGRLGQSAFWVDAGAAVALFLSMAGSTQLSGWVERRVRALATSTDDRLGLARVNLLRGGGDFLLRNDAEGLRLMRQGVEPLRSLAEPMLFAWALNFLGWAQILASRFAEATADIQAAMRIAERMQLAWLRADCSCALALIESLQGQFERADERVRAFLASDLRLTLPALEAVATEVLGGIALMQGRPRDASALFERAHLLYVSHHVERGWGFLMQIERTEALLFWVQEDGEAAVPDLLSRLREHARLSQRRLGHLPLYRGCTSVLRGVYEARRGRTKQARRLFQQALAVRPSPRTTYLDAWVLWRVAIECSRLGDANEQTAALWSQVDAIHRDTGMLGMAQLMAHARALPLR